MKRIKIALIYLFCLIGATCVFLTGCNKSNSRIQEVNEFYKKYVEATEMLVLFENLNGKELETKKTEIIEALNSVESLEKQEQLKKTVDNILSSAKTDDELGVAKALENNYSILIELKDETFKLEFGTVCNLVFSMRKQAKEYIDAQK